jgi:hypothetical protein
MNTAHRTASQHKHRHADPMAMYKTLRKIEPFTPEELLQLALPIRLSFQALRTGQGTESDFHDLAAAINTTMVRSEAVSPLCEMTAIAARDALMRAWHRFERAGRLGFDGPALLEIDAGISLHEELIRNSTPLQMIEALREVMARGLRMQVLT